MGFISNFETLASTKQRRDVLDIVEAGLSSIQPDLVLRNNFFLNGNRLHIQDQSFDLANFDKISLIGFGKGSAGISKYIETVLGDRLNEGFVIDTRDEEFSKIHFTKGSHPLPSVENLNFTDNVIKHFSHRTVQDLVLVVICGGGSAMLVSPDKVTLDQKITVNKALLSSGADIYQMNTVRKHLSAVKGGGLAKILYPATVVSLIFSDVPGNDVSFIASGPTVKDTTTADDAWSLIEKYQLKEKLNLTRDMFTETPKDDTYFENTKQILMLSNVTALAAMRQKAEILGYQAVVYSDKFQSEATEAGKKLVESAGDGQILLAGGETTVTVRGIGTGGRNQEVVLACLRDIHEGVTIASFDSDGWDNSSHAGAIGDKLTVQKANERSLSIEKYLSENNSFEFFEKTGDAIITGRLPSNVSDLFIVLKA